MIRHFLCVYQSEMEIKLAPINTAYYNILSTSYYHMETLKAFACNILLLDHTIFDMFLSYRLKPFRIVVQSACFVWYKLLQLILPQ